MAEHTSDSFGYLMIDLPESVIASPESAIRYMIEKLVEQGRISREHAARGMPGRDAGGPRYNHAGARRCPVRESPVE
jgi:hypothetical protein